MTRRFVFADEAGDFHFAPNGSKYFILCTVLMEDCEIGHELLRLRRQPIWDGFPVGEYFHCSEDRQPVRDRVFSLIAGARGLTVQANILEKSKAQPQVRRTKERFYQYAWFLHLGGVSRRLGGRGDELLVTAASVGTRKQQAAFTSAVNDVAQQHLLHVSWETHFCPAMADPCLQIADYCTWAIQRRWEGGDDRSHQIVRHLINHEYESWRRGTVYFCANIQWMFNRGVTLGCQAQGQPAAYCPTQFVRRDQMAAFMNRLADEAVFQQGGNAFGEAAVLGTTDNQPLDIRVNNAAAMRFQPTILGSNIIGNASANSIGANIGAVTIAGGGAPSSPNTVVGNYGTVGGGGGNVAGERATVPGGIFNRATGLASFAAGTSATATAPGQFVWADSSTLTFDPAVSPPGWADAADTFNVRARGGVWFVTSINLSGTPTAGCSILPGSAAWSCTSSRDAKTDFERADVRDVLE